MTMMLRAVASPIDRMTATQSRSLGPRSVVTVQVGGDDDDGEPTQQSEGGEELVVEAAVGDQDDTRQAGRGGADDGEDEAEPGRAHFLVWSRICLSMVGSVAGLPENPPRYWRAIRNERCKK